MMSIGIHALRVILRKNHSSFLSVIDSLENRPFASLCVTTEFLLIFALIFSSFKVPRLQILRIVMPSLWSLGPVRRLKGRVERRKGRPSLVLEGLRSLGKIRYRLLKVRRSASPTIQVRSSKRRSQAITDFKGTL